MSVTVNGIPCQPWDAPSIDKKPAHNAHVHPISSLFRQYLEGHNHCRNPEGRGERPWCYTLNPHIRWQYCDIPVCPSPMPLLYIKIGLPIAVSVVLVITLLLFLLGCVCCKRRRMKHRFKKEQVAIGPDGLVHLTEMKSASCVNPLYSTNQTRASTEFDALEYEASKLPTYPRDNLTYICDLGQGNFGVVVRAEATGIIPGKDKSTVAVKVLKEGSGAQMKEEFFREATLMNNFNHPNILQLLGVCCEHEPYCMILEHMAEGDLNSLLRRNNPNQTFPRGIADFVGFSIKQMVDMAVDIAAGMSYLAKNHYVHRDLATRNCLVDKELRVKIADFGLSQDVYIDDYFRLKDSEMLPIRWMPPEAILYSKFSLQGDVWSFGVVLWEIFSFGVQPYYGRSNEEVVQYVRDGSVLEPPLNCPQEIYDLMVDCWAMDPSERPTSDELYVGLRRWTPEMSATLLVQTRQPNYQNMSTILEYARRSLDGSATKPNGIVNEGIEEERNGDLSEESSHPVGCPYDHLEPQKAVTSTARENNSPAIPLPAIAEA